MTFALHSILGLDSNKLKIVLILYSTAGCQFNYRSLTFPAVAMFHSAGQKVELDGERRKKRRAEPEGMGFIEPIRSGSEESHSRSRFQTVRKLEGHEVWRL